jgi:hypothetical protein
MANKYDKIVKLSEILWKDQSGKNWDAVPAALKKSTIKYYRIVWANGGKLNKMQDLRKSFANLYDSKYEFIAKLPIFMTNGKKIRGATKYLIGLQVSNKAD